MGIPPPTYDILMLAVLVFCTVFGAWKGMAWQLAALASLVVSAGVAVHGSGPLAPYIGVEAPWNRFIAMLVLYLGTSLAIWVLFRLVAGIIDRVRLKEFDRQVGALFGLAKGLLWCLVITFFAVTLSESARATVLRSRSGYYTALLIHRAAPVLPAEIRDVLGGYIEQLDRKLDPSQARARRAGVLRDLGRLPTEHKKHYQTLRGPLSTGLTAPAEPPIATAQSLLLSFASRRTISM